MTLEAWVAPTRWSGWRTVLLKERAGGLAYALYGVRRPAGGRRVYGRAARRSAPPGRPRSPLNTWTHLAAPTTAPTLRLYVNGTQVATRALTGALTAARAALRSAATRSGASGSQGRIDEVRVYNRALSPADITGDMTRRCRAAPDAEDGTPRSRAECRPTRAVPCAPMPLCFIEPQDAIRVIAESVGREARRQLLGELVRAWVDEIPEEELASHYAKAVDDLDEHDLSMLAAWHASLEVGTPIANKDFLVNAFPRAGREPARGAEDRRRAARRGRVQRRRGRGAGARGGAAVAVARRVARSSSPSASSSTAGTGSAPTTDARAGCDARHRVVACAHMRLARAARRRVARWNSPRRWRPYALPFAPEVHEARWRLRIARAPVMSGTEHAERVGLRDIEEVIGCSLCGEERMQPLLDARGPQPALALSRGPLPVVRLPVPASGHPARAAGRALRGPLRPLPHRPLRPHAPAALRRRHGRLRRPLRRRKRPPAARLRLRGRAVHGARRRSAASRAGASTCRSRRSSGHGPGRAARGRTSARPRTSPRSPRAASTSSRSGR